MADLTSLGPLRLPIRRYAEFEHVPGFVLTATEAEDVVAVDLVKPASPELVLDATEAADVVSLVGTDTVVLAATEEADVAVLAAATETAGLTSLGPQRLPTRRYESFEHTELTVSEFVLTAVEAADVASVVASVEANEFEVVLESNESADVSVFSIAREGDIVLSASEGADIALAEFAFRGQAPEPEGSGYSWRKQKPFLPYKENIFLRSSEEPDNVLFIVMEWARTNEGRRVMKRRRDELVLMMVD